MPPSATGLGKARSFSSQTPAGLTQPHHEECLAAAKRAHDLAATAEPRMETIGRIGEGWIAEEALAIVVYAALVAGRDFARGVPLAVNHRGDGDSTGAIAGNILGVMLGDAAVPAAWLQDLELHDVIEQVADDLFLFLATIEDEISWSRYPGH